MTRDSFLPENIHNFFIEDENCKVINVGSYYWFKDIDEYKQTDYDYVQLIKCDDIDGIQVEKFHYMYLDGNTIFYSNNLSKDQLINALLQYVEDGNRKSPVLCLIHKEICQYFEITYQDIIPYLDRLSKIINDMAEMNAKYSYIKKILEFIIQNENHILNSNQILECFKIYNSTPKNNSYLYKKTAINKNVTN